VSGSSRTRRLHALPLRDVGGWRHRPTGACPRRSTGRTWAHGARPRRPHHRSRRRPYRRRLHTVAAGAARHEPSTRTRARQRLGDQESAAAVPRHARRAAVRPDAPLRGGDAGSDRTGPPRRGRGRLRDDRFAGRGAARQGADGAARAQPLSVSGERPSDDRQRFDACARAAGMDSRRGDGASVRPAVRRRPRSRERRANDPWPAAARAHVRSGDRL
jgi:hypothetical protein